MSAVKLLAPLRRFFWRHVVRYDSEICNWCGVPVGRCFGSWWHAPDELWLTVMPTKAGILCPRCFTDALIKKGILVWWQPVVEPK